MSPLYKGTKATRLDGKDRSQWTTTFQRHNCKENKKEWPGKGEARQKDLQGILLKYSLLKASEYKGPSLRYRRPGLQVWLHYEE